MEFFKTLKSLVQSKKEKARIGRVTARAMEHMATQISTTVVAPAMPAPPAIAFLKQNNNILTRPTKVRLTAIRTGIMPGLYSEGTYKDALEQANQYNVEELHLASDAEYYEGDFFVSDTEKDYGHEIARRTAHINELIEDELV